MELTLIIITLVAVLVNIIVTLLRKPSAEADPARLISMIQQELDRLSGSIKTDISNLKTEFENSFSNLKAELDKNLQANRTELGNNMESLRKTVEERLEKLQESNSKKLEEMRQTVDEKLQKTLNTRLAESFKQVQEQLEKVHAGLGEMTNMAKDVGGLKNALTNVKTKGIIGEIQLEALLSSILSPQQYEKNVQVKANSNERVEFAICLPGDDESGKPIYLPIDSKFPLEPYNNLLKAYDEADANGITSARRELYSFVKNNAKLIRDKYIDPPNTTNWAIMFLPSEGLYAELLQNTQLVMELQRDYQIALAGPTILGAYINSLQMGFKTLAIQKSSSEVWKLLSAVKTQFSSFGVVLERAQKKIAGVSTDLDTLVGRRTRQIQAKLRNVEELPQQEASAMLEMDILELEEDEEEEV
ncbi:MAG: DNA recombination protein RmuC [Candidatus Cloacimonadaceae bacterium]|jgi:DNA recombination protein RmuC